VSNYIGEEMNLSHIDDVVEIENLSFKTPWSKSAFIYELTKNKCSKYRVILKDGKVVAYGGMWILLDEAHITNIAVHPEYRGIGLGKMIVEHMIKAAKGSGVTSMTLEVRVGNIPAINLYKKYGFEEVAIRKGYYQDTGEDALIMWKYDI
jgi:ribosomal-protein-alanine N-acetyltransferase